MTSTVGLIFFIKPCKTLPGPHSMYFIAPSAVICKTLCVHFTGAVNCAIQFNLISEGLLTALAVTFW
jgi:hypothetical protein